MYVEHGKFTIDNEMEQVYLEGNYKIDTIVYTPDFEHDFEDSHIQNQSLFYKSNVLIRTDTENINELINLFAKYTFVPCQDLDLDFSVAKSEQWMGGTICPTKKTLFVYKSKVFVAYGRYIFGYDERFALFQRQGAPEGDVKLNEITKDAIKLEVPEFDAKCYTDYVYTFMIYDQQTSVVDAFGLYR